MLQVLTGTAKGKRLKVPRGNVVRPPTSRIKKSIFDTLGDISGFKVLDIFAGSGSLGIESLSRDALHVTFIEKNPLVYKALRGNISLCGFNDRATLVPYHYEAALKKLQKRGERFNLIFIDPPYILYGKQLVDDFINRASEMLEDGGVIVIEHNYKIENTPAGFLRITKPFGGTHVSFFRRGGK